MMNLYLIEIILMNIGQKQQKKEIIQLNLGKKLAQMILRKFGMVMMKSKNSKLSILELVI